jgi:hypothetical protein
VNNAEANRVQKHTDAIRGTTGIKASTGTTTTKNPKSSKDSISEYGHDQPQERLDKH